MTPRIGSAGGGITLTVTGRGFGANADGVHVEVAGERCAVRFADPLAGATSDVMYVTLPHYGAYGRLRPDRAPPGTPFALQRGLRMHRWRTYDASTAVWARAASQPRSASDA